jgi:DNA-binding CsgD family transcriptional regulator
LPRPSRSERYSRFFSALDRAALDPPAWREVCDGLAGLLDAAGAGIIPSEPALRTTALPYSERLGELVHRYVAEGWLRHDIRAEKGFSRAVRTGFAVDQDYIAPEEMRRHPLYADLLASGGLQWSLAIAFAVKDRPWVASIQGSPARGPFGPADVKVALGMRGRVALAATAAAALGDRRIESVRDVLTEAGRGVVAVGVGGQIAWLNEPADEMLRDAELARYGKLRSKHDFVGTRLADMIDAAALYRWSGGLRLPGPVTVPGRGGRVYSVNAIPMPRDFQALLSGVQVLVTIYEVAPAAGGLAERLRERFQLTPKQIELAEHLAAGRSLRQAADAMGIVGDTARDHLKQIFSKTGTNRQATLVALLAKLDR